MDANQNDPNQPNTNTPNFDPSQQQDEQQPQSDGKVSITPRGKETGPVGAPMGEVADYVQPAAHETAPVLEQSVENAGVEVTPSEQEVQLSEEQKAAGIQLAKESTPVTLSSPQSVAPVPWTPEETEKYASASADLSRTWYAKLLLLVLGQKKYQKEQE